MERLLQLGREEILTIVRELFIGNHVEQGEVVIAGHCRADLSRIRTPLVIFCSYGDNISPPNQALAWLKTAYASTDSLVRAGQRTVYLLHEHVGHLGIFVSADVARHEHRAILHHAAVIQALAPGLYEMKLDPPPVPATPPAPLSSLDASRTSRSSLDRQHSTGSTPYRGSPTASTPGGYRPSCSSLALRRLHAGWSSGIRCAPAA